MRLISAAAALAAFGVATVAWAQTAPPNGALAGPPEPRRGGLVFHVSGGRGQPTVVSLGLAENGAAGAVLRQRRQMQADCKWTRAPDLPVDADQIVPLQNPGQLGGAERFGAYYATVFGALTTSWGSTATAAQQNCVRRTMTQVGESLLRREASKGDSSRGSPLPDE